MIQITAHDLFLFNLISLVIGIGFAFTMFFSYRSLRKKVSYLEKISDKFKKKLLEINNEIDRVMKKPSEEVNELALQMKGLKAQMEADIQRLRTVLFTISKGRGEDVTSRDGLSDRPRNNK